MANNSILKLQVDDKQYEASLKNAQQGLKALQDALRNSGKSFADVDKQTEEYVRELGKMNTTAKTARGSIGEMSSAFVELSRVEKQLTDQERQSPVGKALAESLSQLRQRTIDAKNELQELESQLKNVGDAKQLDGGGLFGKGGIAGMMQVAGGNLLSQGISKLSSELVGAIGQSIELAKQGEGIRIAFDRLNRPDLLDQLKEATHGTVSELELMKQAVKFNDFNLNLDEMGTLLAFAQQKAKDTGQSVDYMVDSIVTGLGRQSLMILDNLGLSAAEIKERMKEGGDMTTAVASIIKDQMSEAGEYIETAADRAARAAADAANEMEAFGRTAAPIAEEWSQTWNTLTIGAMKFANTLLGPVARSIRSIQNILNTNPEDRITGSKYNLFNGYTNQGPATKPTWGDIPVKTAPGGYVEVTDRNTGAVLGGQHFENLQDTNSIKTWQKTLGKSGSKSGKGGTSPQEQAEKKVAEALHAYQQTIEQSAIELKAGTITEAGAKKKELQAQERLWDAYGDAYNIYKADKYKEAQDKTAQEIVRLGGEVKSHTDEEEKAKQAARELAQIQKKVATAMEEAQTAYQGNDLKGYLSAMKKAGADPSQGIAAGGFTYTDANLKAFTDNLKGQLSQADIGSTLYTNLTAQLADATALGNLMQQAVKNGIDIAQFAPQDLWKQIFGGDNIDDSVWQSLADLINEKLKELNIEPIQIDFNTGNVKKQSKEMSKDWKNAASAIQEVGSAMSQIEDPAAKVVGTVAQAIATVALGFAQATVQASSMGPWAWIAFAATGLATMVSTISAIHSATGYANGGIVEGSGYVPGNSFSGDNTLIRANAGELVLNRAGQSTLISALEGNQNNERNVQPYVNGEQIFLGLTTYLKRSGRGELITSRR